MHLHPFSYALVAFALVFQGCASSQKKPETAADASLSQADAVNKQSSQTEHSKGEQKLIASMLKDQGQDKLINAVLKNSEGMAVSPHLSQSKGQAESQNDDQAKQSHEQTEPQNAAQAEPPQVKPETQSAAQAEPPREHVEPPKNVQQEHPMGQTEHVAGNSESHHSGNVSILLLGDDDTQAIPHNSTAEAANANQEAEPLPPPEPEPENQVDYVALRKEALSHLRARNGKDASSFWALVDNDPLMTRTLDREVRPHGTNSISALGGGSTVSFKYVDTADESAKAALKPDQDLRQTMYRSEIAYYRLCQIIECSFDTPLTRPVRFSNADFNTLYNASTSSKNKGYRIKFEHLIWEKENGTKYLYAAYKEWISPFDGFPIEATNVWSPYLQNPKADLPEKDKFLHRLLAAGRPADSGNLNKFIEYTRDMTTRDLLQQISDIVLIDYLTNNWDRFAGDVNNYGANCHFQPGGIIAIDNGAAFPPWHAPRVVRRLNLVQMFSKNLVTNLRMLDENELIKRLFPNPTSEEKKSIARFKERRRDALKYIDGLIEKKGVNNVLVF